MPALSCAWCLAYPKRRSAPAIFLGCYLSVVQAKSGGDWKLLSTGILGILLHWQVGMCPLGQGESTASLSRAPVFHLGCVWPPGEIFAHAWAGKTVPAVLLQGCLLPPTLAKLVTMCFVSERGRGAAASSGDVPGRVSTQLSTATQVQPQNTWCGVHHPVCERCLGKASCGSGITFLSARVSI